MDQLLNFGSLSAALTIIALIALTISIHTTARLRREVAEMRGNVQDDLRRAITEVNAVVSDLRTVEAPPAARSGDRPSAEALVAANDAVRAESGVGMHSPAHTESYDGWMGRSAECFGGLILFGFAVMWAGGWAWATGTIAVPWLGDLLSSMAGGLASGDLFLVAGDLAWLLLALVISAGFGLVPTIVAAGVAFYGLLHVVHAMLRTRWLDDVLRRAAGRQAALAL